MAVLHWQRRHASAFPLPAQPPLLELFFTTRWQISSRSLLITLRQRNTFNGESIAGLFLCRDRNRLHRDFGGIRLRDISHFIFLMRDTH